MVALVYFYESYRQDIIYNNIMVSNLMAESSPCLSSMKL